MDYAGRVSETAAEVERDVFHLCLPIAQQERPQVVEALFDDGYVTVIRLPLKSEDARADAVAQFGELDQDPPALLFLRRITELILEAREQGETTVTALLRHEEAAAHFEEVAISKVDLGPAGQYLVADKTVDADAFDEAIERSIAGDKISDGWRDWQGQAHVSIAVPLDAELETGRLYTYLPMGPDASAPLPAHVNAPFFAKLARVDLEESVPVNDMLLDEIAELCARLLLAVSHGGVVIAVENAADLLSWTAPGHQRLLAAFARLNTDLDEVACIPVVGSHPTWATLRHSVLWDDSEYTVFTAARLTANVRVPVIAGLSEVRSTRLDRSAQLLTGRSLMPTETTIAEWSERVAEALTSDPFDADTWGRFYDELAHLVDDPELLQRRRVLIDDDRKLRRCNSKEGDGRSAVAFFSPRADQDDAGDDDLKPPSRLRRRVFYVNTQISWRQRIGSVEFNRAGRKLTRRRTRQRVPRQ